MSLLERILRHITDEEMYLSLSEDLFCRYEEDKRAKGVFTAKVFRSQRCFLMILTLSLENILGECGMIKNNLKISLRHILRQKGYSFINIAGLSVGMAVSMLILLFIRFELSYDGFHENASSIYRVTRRFDTPTGYKPHFARVPDTWINNLPNEFPEINKLIRLQYEPQVDLRIGEKKLRTYKWFSTDAEVFEVFTFPLIQGIKESALAQPYSVVVTEEIALKYFGTTNVLGREIEFLGPQPGASRLYTITGILEKLPLNSHFQVEFLASYPNERYRQGWAWVYLLLTPGTNPEQLESKFPSFIERQTDAENAQTSFLHLQALRDIHLRSHLDRELQPNGDIRYIYIFGVVAVLVLLIACFNFMNLSTARSMQRTREIGIRKVLGAFRSGLAKYFLHESMLYAALAFMCALILVLVFFPLYNVLMDNRLTINLFFDGRLIVSFLIICLGTGLFAGSYPAFVLSSMRPLHILSGGNRSTNYFRGLRPGMRKVLVVLQFTLSILLIVCTLISTAQFSFLSNSKLGMKKDQIIAIRNISPLVKGRYPSLRAELQRYPNIIGVSASMEVPSRDILDAGFCRVEGLPAENDPPALAMMAIDVNYINFMEIELLTGEGFAATEPFTLPGEYRGPDQQAYVQNFILNKDRSYIINESVLDVYGWRTPQEAIGKRIDWRNAAFQTSYGEIVGVVKDFHYTTLRSQIRPLLMMYEPLFLGCILIKIDTQDVPGALADVEEVWNRLFPDLAIQYDFVDELFADLYRTEQRQGKLLGLFAALAIFIAFLGLFGLASFTAEQRTKEIGIRKVVGATVSRIVLIFTREFTKWIIFAALLSAPPAYWIMQKWLQTYAYHISMPWWPYLSALAIVFLVAVLTVGYQSMKAARANPVDALKYE